VCFGNILPRLLLGFQPDALADNVRVHTVRIFASVQLYGSGDFCLAFPGLLLVLRMDKGITGRGIEIFTFSMSISNVCA
jgi:hypothetical protein